MRIGFKLASVAVAALMVMPSVASAADFITLRYDVSGFGQTVTVSSIGGNQNVITRQGALDSVLEIVLPGNGRYDFAEPGYGASSYRVNGSTLTGQGYRCEYRAPEYSFTLSGLFTTQAGSYDIRTPFSTSIDFSQSFGSSFTGAGAYTQFTGVLTHLTVTEGFGTPAQFGLILAPVYPLPEPATWAMMLLGMGAVGFAMRRRQKVSTSVKFA